MQIDRTLLIVTSLLLSSLCSQAEPEGFSHFHLYVCAAFLVRWRKEILEEKDFQVRFFLCRVVRSLSRSVCCPCVRPLLPH